MPPSMRSATAHVVLALGLTCSTMLTSCANPDDGAEGETGVSSEKILTELTTDPEIAAMVPKEIADRGSITVAVNPSSPPIKFLDGEGQITGFTPQLITAAGTLMGLEVDLRQTSFDALVPGLEARRFDIILSINDLPERRKQIDFIDYLKTGTAILGAAGLDQDQVTPETLCGHSIGYVRGNTQQSLVERAGRDCAADGKAAVQGTGFQDLNAALLAVQSGQVELAWGDASSVSYNVETNDGVYKLLYREISGMYGVGVNKEDAELRDALHAALRRSVESGAYQALLEDYGLAESSLPELPLNAGPADDGA